VCFDENQCARFEKLDAGSQAQTQRARPKLAAMPKASVVEEVVAKVAVQVSQNDTATMNMALNNARNIIDQYKSQKKKVEIEMVAYGPGLHMLRADTSPVKDRIATMSLEHPNLHFVGCANTQANQSKAEGKKVELLKEATLTPSGVVLLIELQEKGYAYVRP
jgi:intracellular sulfur oxidation DsrE/DsrF family protein